MNPTRSVTGPQRSAAVVFLAHSSGDKAHVREIHRLLSLDGFEPWLDEQNLIPGQNWELEVKEALRKADAIAVFLSSTALNNAGYVHKEIQVALDAAERQPEGAILVIPIKLDDQEVPRKLRHLHWIDSSCSRWYPVLTKRIRFPENQDILREFSIGDRYLQLQRALLVRDGEVDPYADPWLFFGAYGVGGRIDGSTEFLVRGQCPAGDRYYGLASMVVVNNDVKLETRIEGQVYEYNGYLSGESISFGGAHNVEYWMSQGSGLLVGSWDNGGIEELIPARSTVQADTEAADRKT